MEQIAYPAPLCQRPWWKYETREGWKQMGQIIGEARGVNQNCEKQPWGKTIKGLSNQWGEMRALDPDFPPLGCCATLSWILTYVSNRMACLRLGLFCLSFFDETANVSRGTVTHLPWLCLSCGSSRDQVTAAYSHARSSCPQLLSVLFVSSVTTSLG